MCSPTTRKRKRRGISMGLFYPKFPCDHCGATITEKTALLDVHGDGQIDLICRDCLKGKR